MGYFARGPGPEGGLVVTDDINLNVTGTVDGQRRRLQFQGCITMSGLTLAVSVRRVDGRRAAMHMQASDRFMRQPSCGAPSALVQCDIPNSYGLDLRCYIGRCSVSGLSSRFWYPIQFARIASELALICFTSFSLAYIRRWEDELNWQSRDAICSLNIYIRISNSCAQLYAFARRASTLQVYQRWLHKSRSESIRYGFVDIG